MQFDLVFEGGGAKGMIFVGAMQIFEANQHSFARLLGASAGAITAALLAAGYDSAEMEAALGEKEDGVPVFTKFMSEPLPFTEQEVRNSSTLKLLQGIDIPLVPNRLENRFDAALAGLLLRSKSTRRIFSLIERGGLYSARHFISWLENKLDTGIYNRSTGNHGQGNPRRFSQMTLKQFYKATNTDLSLIASDTMGNQMLVLNHRTTPDCPLVMAVRMSMSIPLLWEEVVWQADWGPYLEKSITGHTIVDGGMLSNFPIELFISRQPYVTAVMGEKRASNVLGFLIDEHAHAENLQGLTVDEPEETGFSFGQLQTVQRLSRLVNTMTQAHDKMVIDAFAPLIVRLPAKGFGTTEFDMSEERKAALVGAGKHATTGYFTTMVQPTSMSLSSEEGFDEEAAIPTYMQTAEAAADKLASKILAP